MRIKGIKNESFSDYKLPSMYIAFPHCSFKCDRENNQKLCQNSHLAQVKEEEVDIDTIINLYLTNPLTQAIVFAGLEPLDSQEDVINFLEAFRIKYQRNDPIIIYTGYTETELESGEWGISNNSPEQQSQVWNQIKNYNLIVKFGRYLPDQKPHYDKMLGVELASNNQYAKEFINEN